MKGNVAMNKMHEYYAKGEERERLDERFGRVEFLTTVHYIKKFLFPGAKILEIGAGAGRYSHHFARMGFEVSAIEPVDLHIEQFKADTVPGERISIIKGDSRDLSDFADKAFDITLILGPLYHLPDTEDKRKTISEALRVTKNDGIVFAAYILNEMTVMNYLFRRNKISDKDIAARAKQNNYVLSEISEKGLSICRIEDIDALMGKFSVERLHLVGTDMFSGMIRDLLTNMTEETFDRYVEYVFSICERPDMIGLSGHLLDVFRKC